MEQTLDFVFSLLTGLLRAFVRASVWLESHSHDLMNKFHIDEGIQKVIITTIVIFLLFTGWRMFGRVVGIILTFLFIIMMIHIFWPDLLTGFDKPGKSGF